VYEIRAAGNTTGRPDRIAVNLDPTESDLSPMDPTELVAAVTGRAADPAAQTASAADISVEEVEKQQGLWWYLLFAGLLLLAAEMVVSNLLSRAERFLKGTVQPGQPGPARALWLRRGRPETT
jgi:hypothetical protein